MDIRGGLSSVFVKIGSMDVVKAGSAASASADAVSTGFAVVVVGDGGAGEAVTYAVDAFAVTGCNIVTDGTAGGLAAASVVVMKEADTPKSGTAVIGFDSGAFSSSTTGLKISCLDMGVGPVATTAATVVAPLLLAVISG